MKLTPSEIALAHAVGFEEEVLSLIKEQAGASVVRVVQADEDGGASPGPGVSAAVTNGDEAEHLINAIREPLAARGYRPFWSERHEPNGLKETDEVAVLKTKDPYAMMRLRLTDGANYDITTDDIVERLESWRKLAVFDVVGASRDWVALQFSRLPEDLCKFAEEVFLFCSDSVTQGVGFTDRHNKTKIEAARKLCPDPISPAIQKKLADKAGHVTDLMPDLASSFGGFEKALYDEVDTGIRLLAYEIRQTKFLFLWWD